MNESFKRVELKYLITQNELNQLLKKLKSKIIKDQYYKSTICNLYFDNDNYDFIQKSNEKPIYKEKIRLRSYNTPTLSDYVYLEVKQKYNHLVSKKRYKLKLSDYNEYHNKFLDLDNSYTLKEIDNIIKKGNLKPKIFIAYNRTSYKTKEDGIRITFDTDLRYRKDNLSLEYGSQGKLFFDKRVYIMEIKTINTMPIWLINVFNELKIFPLSFSKYGEIYQKGLI